MSISTSELDALLRGIQRAVPDRKAARQSLDTGSVLDRSIWTALSEMGIPGAPLPETLGGSSLGLTEQVAIVEALANMVTPVPIAASFLAAHILGRSTPHAERYAADLVSGSAIVGVCLSASASLPQGLNFSADEKFSGEIADVMDGNAIDTLLIWHDGKWRAVDMNRPGVERRTLRTLDPTHALATIRFDNADSMAVSAADPSEVMARAWVLMAAEALGAAQVAMGMATRYALDRRQFGEQIGRFQAIKHKLANMLVAVEGARSAILGAARGVGAGVPDLRLARMAKLLAGAAGVEVVGESIQIHGAIGCTWEHDLHLLLRRAKYCQLALQSDQQHLAVLADELLADTRKADKPKNRSIKREFDLDQADMDFSDELRSWLDAHATKEKIAELRGRDVGVLRAWQGKLADAGWAGIHWPRRFGGRNATFKQQVLYHSELAARGLPTLIGNRALSLIGPTLIVHGTPEQQAFFLEPSRRADFLWASGMSEPGSGSDLASLRTRGEIDGDDLVINGQKIWTSGAHRSEWLYTLVRTGALVPKHEGITCILIPLSSKGLTIRPIKRMNGVPEFNEIFFDNVRVPLRNVMGEIGDGWRVARTTLAHEHMTNFLGAQLRQSYFVDRIITQLAEREIREGTIDHSLRQRVGQAWINTQLLRLHGLRNMTQIVEGNEPGSEGSILKLFGQEEERRLYELAVDVRGAGGLTSDNSGRGYLGARAATIGGGTSEIHRNKIAERVLGMPRDPWADN